MPQIVDYPIDVMDMHVRPARVGDRERLLELWERSVRATHHFLEDSDVVALRPLVAEELASDATRLVGAGIRHGGSDRLSGLRERHD